ncbi:MAG: ABC transporter ATP-binding protein [Peptostreptococcaceae bacterium]|nr:ABC transporter ATP-binding protein [Peptostreptococcaceae bacterium]
MKEYLKERRPELAMLTFFSLISTMLGVRIQFVKGDILDIAIYGGKSNLWAMIMLLLVLIALEMGTFYFFDLFRAKYAVGNNRKLRKSFFMSLFKLSPIAIQNKKSGEYIAQYTNESDMVLGGYFGVIPLLIEIIIKIIIVSVSLFWLDASIAVLTLFLLTTPLYVPKLVEGRLQKAQRRNVEAFEKHLSKVMEWLSGFELIRHFSMTNVVEKQFDESISEVLDASYQAKKLAAMSRVLSGLLSYLSHFIILAVAAFFVANKKFSAGKFFVAVSMIDQLSYPIISLSMYIKDLVSSKEVAEKFIKNIDERLGMNSDSKQGLEECVRQVQFEKVSFSYGEDTLIRDFNLELQSGEKCLIMGASGSGKSTLMNLLLGYYQPSDGRVCVNEIESEDIGNLNYHIAVMRQEPFLFSDTLRNNLTMYREIDDERLVEMLKRLRLDKFASKEALDKMITENGNNLSGGEKKRISLARVLLSDASILILDEPLANVDGDTVSKIEDIIVEIEDKILFVVTHQFDEEKKKVFDKQVQLVH